MTPQERNESLCDDATARLTVYLDVDLQDDAARLPAEDVMAAMQNLVGTQVLNTPTTWAEITGVEVGSCAISRVTRSPSSLSQANAPASGVAGDGRSTHGGNVHEQHG